MISLLRFLFVVCILFVFRLLLGMILGAGSRARQGARQSGPRTQPSGSVKHLGMMVKDPVCGTYVDPALAVTVVRGSQSVSFCSAACRDQYQSNRAAS